MYDLELYDRILLVLDEMEVNRKKDVDNLELVSDSERLKAYITGRYDEIINMRRIIQEIMDLQICKH